MNNSLSDSIEIKLCLWTLYYLALEHSELIFIYNFALKSLDKQYRDIENWPRKEKEFSDNFEIFSEKLGKDVGTIIDMVRRCHGGAIFSVIDILIDDFRQQFRLACLSSGFPKAINYEIFFNSYKEI